MRRSVVRLSATAPIIGTYLLGTKGSWHSTAIMAGVSAIAAVAGMMLPATNMQVVGRPQLG